MADVHILLIEQHATFIWTITMLANFLRLRIYEISGFSVQFSIAYSLAKPEICHRLFLQ